MTPDKYTYEELGALLVAVGTVMVSRGHLRNRTPGSRRWMGSVNGVLIQILTDEYGIDMERAEGLLCIPLAEVVEYIAEDR